MEFTEEVKKATDPIYQKISKVLPEIEWSVHAPYIHRINQLKKEKNAIILAHNYQTPEIYHGIADVAADSLALAIEASKTEADIIVMAGVHFMAETSKLMSPEKKVLLPDMAAGCSLSSSITGKDVRLLKEKYPGVPVVSYVNTSADVKAETDICCTSANAVKIVESLGVKKVIFLPDDYLAKYVASQTDVEIIAWKGICMVHDQFTEKEIHDIREKNPGIKIIAHPECPPEVINASDFAGSTSGMIKYVEDNENAYYLGEKYGNEKINILKCMNAVIVPSIHEPFGIVCLEALASKCILLSSFQSGMKEYLTEDIALNCGVNSSQIEKSIKKWLNYCASSGM